MIAVREKLMQRFGVAVDETVIEVVLRFGEADIGKQYLDAIRESAAECGQLFEISHPGILLFLR